MIEPGSKIRLPKLQPLLYGANRGREAALKPASGIRFDIPLTSEAIDAPQQKCLKYQ